MRRLTPERLALRRSAIRLRRELGWSAEAIARQLGIAPRTARRWVNVAALPYTQVAALALIGQNDIGANGHNGPLALNTVHIMDVLEGLPLLAPDSIDLVFTDPPYNNGVGYDADKGDSLPATTYLEWCEEWFRLVHRCLRPGGSFYVMHYPDVAAMWVRPLNILFRTRGPRRWITWHYATNIGQSARNWTRSQRAILFYTKGDDYYFDGLADPQPYRNPTDRRIRSLVQAGRTGAVSYDVWYYDLVKNVSKEKTRWPNQLPLPLVERVVKVSSKPNDIVLDPFIGSGTTAVAAASNGRRWLGFDWSEESRTETEERLGKLRV